jgi:hypothetical protein
VRSAPKDKGKFIVIQFPCSLIIYIYFLKIYFIHFLGWNFFVIGSVAVFE